MARTTKTAATKAAPAPRIRKPKTVTLDPTSPEFAEAVATAVAAALAAQNATPEAVTEVELDPVQALVAKQGLSFAKGGRAYVTIEAATAVARVMKTGTPEVVKAAEVPSEKRRSVTHLAVFRTETGAVALHPLYKAA